MAEVKRPRQTAPVLEIAGLDVFYGASHALQGVDLTLEQGVLAVVGRNGMGKTTLCNAITGLLPLAKGSIRFQGRELRGLSAHRIAHLGVGYVPQGRRLWPSLTVDEHLRLGAGGRRGNWSIERIYQTFPRLAERRSNSGGQLSGGEQQMLAIARALLTNPKLLVMDEPTEGLAPVIVARVEDMLLQLGEEGEMAVLVIEQNLGVATAVSEEVAIMANGRISRRLASTALAQDRDLQQRLLGVGRHLDGASDQADAPPETTAPGPGKTAGPPKVYLSNPLIPTRWSAPVPAARIERAARTLAAAEAGTARVKPLAPPAPATTPTDGAVLVAGTLDTKGPELKYIRNLIKAAGLKVLLVDLSTSGKPSAADIPPHQVAVYHPRGASGVFGDDRGQAVAAMAVAFEAWIQRQEGIAGLISAGGSGGTALATPAMRSLSIGVPKLMVSTVASGDVQGYVGPADIAMMYSVTDVQGLNAISREVLANAAGAMVGMVQGRLARAAGKAAAPPKSERPAIGLTMFGLTTPCVQQVTHALEADYECLVFHATGVGGRSMEKLVDSGFMAGIVDITTTEVCDLFMGGIFAASEDRFGAVIRAGMPYVGSCGALDMVNFGAPDTVPAPFKDRLFYHHNPQVTLMRTTPEENRRMGVWIGERLNRMTGPVRFLLPTGGVSGLDAPGKPFYEPAANRALFEALEATVRQTPQRQLLPIDAHINDPPFAKAIVEAFYALHGQGRPRRRQAKS